MRGYEAEEEEDEGLRGDAAEEEEDGGLRGERVTQIPTCESIWGSR